MRPTGHLRLTPQVLAALLVAIPMLGSALAAQHLDTSPQLTLTANGTTASFGLPVIPPAAAWHPGRSTPCHQAALPMPSAPAPPPQDPPERHSKLVTGLVIGFVAGALIGGVIGYAADEEGNDVPPEQVAAVGAGIGALSGAVIGAVIGSSIHEQRSRKARALPIQATWIPKTTTSYDFRVLCSW